MTAAGNRRAGWRSAYIIGMSNFLFEFAIATLGNSTVLVLAAYAAFLAALAVFNVGIARRYSVPVPWMTMAVFFVASLVTCYLIKDMSRQSFMRMLLYQSPYFIMQAIAVGIVAQAKVRSSLDNVLMVLLAASGLQFLSKPFLFQAFGGTGDSPDKYLTTTYALFSQSMGTVFAMAVALMMLVILVRDVLADANARSETDTLSGLLNRGGFEAHAAIGAAGSAPARRAGVAGDLRPRPLQVDQRQFRPCRRRHGDRHLRALPALGNGRASSGGAHRRRGVRHSAARHQPGRGAALRGRRAQRLLLAYGRGACPTTKRFTASFGVAELAGGESITDLMARADKALYLAKNSGRDCVKIAPRPGGRRAGDGEGAAISLV